MDRKNLSPSFLVALKDVSFSRLSNSLKELNLWFQKNQRDLPFRKNPSVYHVYISELMLQQTTIKTAIPYFERFIKKFPSLKDLANSSLEEILELWSGLGYYSRARNLHKCAQILTQQNKDLPTDPKELLALPGIGPYTAGAILSIGYNLTFPIVDTNVIRVLSRLQSLSEFKPPHHRIWRLAKILVSYALQIGIEPRVFNQALMELGSLICTPSKPNCPACPLKNSCKVHLQHRNPEIYPTILKKEKKVLVKENRSAFIIRENKSLKLFIVKDPQKKWLKDLWDTPPLPTSKVLKDVFETIPLNYTITQHKITRLTSIVLLDKKSEIPKDLLLLKHQWIALDDLLKPDFIAASSALRKTANNLKKLDFSGSLW